MCGFVGWCGTDIQVGYFFSNGTSHITCKKKFGGERRGKGEAVGVELLQYLWNSYGTDGRTLVEQGAGSLGFENRDSRSSGLLQWEFAADQNELSNEDLSQFVKNQR